LKILILLYADDTVLLAEDPIKLQNCLNDFVQYCDTWNLNINISKTKVLIFGTRVDRNYSFKIGDTALEIVKSYKYLGTFFAKSGSFLTTRKHLAQQARKALHLLYKRIYNLNLPIDLIFKLFDNTITPILTYSSEIWGYEDCTLVEKIHCEFIRKVLHLRKSTPLYMLYAESCRYPIEITIKSRMIGYWNRLITGKQSKIAFRIYKYMLNLPDFESKWIKKVKSILVDTGRNDIWLHQNGIRDTTVKYKIKDILLGQNVQSWHTSLANSSKGINYSLIKNNMNLESYLLK